MTPSAWLVAAAVALPPLVAYNLPPTPTLFNQLSAVALWGVAAVGFGAGTRAPEGLGLRIGRAPMTLLLALGLVALGVLSSLALPAGLAASALATIVAAAVIVLFGAASARQQPHASYLDAFLWGLVAAGAASVAVALVQVLAPDAAGGAWLARTSLPGRAVGNVRQPNHLATLLVCAAVAVVALSSRRGSARTRLAIGAAVLFVALIAALTLTGSRTGALGTLVLAAWGAVDRRLAPRCRWLLVSAPLVYALAWASLASWPAGPQALPLGTGARGAGGDVSASRFGIWRDTLALIAAQPWRGVGFGEFNLAWTMTPFPARPTAHFDHAHNLVLHLVAELGVPLGGLVCALLAAALAQALRRAWRVDSEDGQALRGCAVIVVMFALHSQLEYPLWYAHFLLPAAFAWSACLGAGADMKSSGTRSAARIDRPADSPSRGAGWRSRAAFASAGVVMVAGALVATREYLGVASIYGPGVDATPLEQRIAGAQRGAFFAHHANYALATTAERPADVMTAFRSATHNLLDTRLMIAWARAYAQQGDLDRARYIADRLREFRNPASKDFFAACDGDPDPRPFQCDPPSRQLTWRDFAGKP